MAEPVIVPVQLEVTDIDMSAVDFKDAQKTISAQMSSIKKSVQDAFKGIDASAINKPIESAMNSVKKSVQAAEDAQLRYVEAMRRAGASTKEFKQETADIDARVEILKTALADYEKKGYTWLPEYKELKTELDDLIDTRSRIDPIKFVDKASPMQLEKVAHAYKKVLSAQENLNTQSEKFNQTMQDNRTSDEYNELLKQAEAYKKKLEELDAKSKRMEALGATDKQWEALRYDTEQVSSSLDGVVKKMREVVKEGSALRFGDGPKGDLSRQINSLAMSGGNRAGNIQKRATENQSPYTEDYQKSLDELDKLEKKIEAIREKSAKMVELGASQKQFQSIAYDAEQLDVKVDEVKNHLMNMVNEGGAFKFGTGDADAEIQKVRDKSAGLQSTLTNVATNAKKAQGGLTALGATNPKLAAVLNVAQKIAVGFGKVLKVAGKVASVIAKGFVGAVKVLGKVASAVGRVASGFINLGKRIFSGIKNIKLFGKSGSTASTDMNKRFKKLTKNFLMFGLGFRTAYYAIKRLRNIFIESFKVMGDQFDEIGQPMMTMMESFNRLKGSLATAFQPLVSVVMPILTQFMNYMSGVLEGIGKFMATLTGQNKIYKAVAKDINSVADAAGNANDKLGAYDKLEVIGQDNNKTGVDYEMQEIGTEDAASNFATMVKEAWKNADFTEVGQFVTEKLLGVLDVVEKNLVPKVTGLVNKVLKSINTFLTGFDATAIGDKIGSIINTLVNGLDWAQLGAVFANINNTVWGFLDGLANGIDWTNLGQSVATGITSIFSTLDLGKWVGMISGFANGITTALYNMLNNVDWASVAVQLGTAVNNLFTRIDLAQIGTTINTLFTALWTLIGNFFATVDFEMIASSIAAGINNIFNGGSGAFNEAMPTIANGLVTFITTAITQIDWSNIATVLLDGIQTVFASVGGAMKGSNNPLMAAFGGVVEALGDVIKELRPALNAVMSALAPIVQSILPVVSEILPPIAEIISNAVVMVMPVLVELFNALMPILSRLMQTLLPIILDLLTSLQPIFDALTNTVLPVIVHLLDACMPLISGLLNLITSILAPVMSLIGPLLEIVFNILDPVITILEPILAILGTLCDVIAVVLRPILDALLPVMDAVNAVFEILSPLIKVSITPLTLMADKFKFVAGIATAILVPAMERIKTIVGIVSNVVKAFANVFTTVFSTIQKVIESVMNILRKPLNAILGAFESVSNGIIKGINAMVNALNKLSFDVPDWVPGMGGKKFGFNLKQVSEIKIPRLAQGAVIPPNNEFLAMLGDQKKGTNIEAPLDTIKQALAEVLAEVGGGSREPVILQVNGRTLAQVVWDEQEKRYKQTGRYSPA